MSTNTLVVYDTTGRIITTAIGDVIEPVGVPFLWVEVPKGKYVTSIDVSKDIHIVVLGDVPKSTVDEVAELRQSVLELSMLVAGGGA